MTQLARTGVVVRRADGRLAVAFDEERCGSCDGRCGLRLGRTPSLALANLRIGSTVEVVVAARRLEGRAAVVFGLPVAAMVGAAALTESGAGHPLWVLGAALVGLAVPFLLRLIEPRQPGSVVRRGGALRVELG